MLAKAASSRVQIYGPPPRHSAAAASPCCVRAAKISSSNCRLWISPALVPPPPATSHPPLVSERSAYGIPAGLGNADLSGGGFAFLTTKVLTISTANKVAVTVPVPGNLKLTILPATGFFSGTVIPTGSLKVKHIYGVLQQGGVSSVGRGFFLNGILPGRVRLRGQ